MSNIPQIHAEFVCLVPYWNNTAKELDAETDNYIGSKQMRKKCTFAAW